MPNVLEGGTLEVSPHEIFVIERRSLAGGGAQTIVRVPEGIIHQGTRDPEPGRNFGGRPKIEEKFECDRPGTFEIHFVSGRPWEAQTTSVITTVICR